MLGRIDETLQQPEFFQPSFQHESKREFPNNCTQQVKSEVKTEASPDVDTVEVMREVQSECRKRGEAVGSGVDGLMQSWKWQVRRAI